MRNKIILGTVQFGLDYGINNSRGQITETEIHKILHFCKKSGILILDTAAAYGNSEERIGGYISSFGDPRKFRIITKLSLKNNLRLIDSLNQSLCRLNISCVDTIMFHSFQDFKNTSLSELNALIEYKGNKFLKLGISVYTNEEILEVSDLNVFDVIQLPFNVLDNQNLRGNLLCYLKDIGFETHIRSVFLQGLFFVKLNRIPKNLRPLVKYLRKLEELANEYNISKESLALQYACSKDYIDNVLVGVDTLKQLKNNFSSMQQVVPKAVFNEVDNIIVDEVELLNPASWNP